LAGWHAAKNAASEPPSEIPNSAALSIPTASITARTSSMRSSIAGSSGTRSESPVPRLSNRTIRQPWPSLSSQRASRGSVQ
jgi:hypothetical protein